MFKQGDIVRCITKEFGNETIGRLYEVLGPGGTRNWFRTIDDFGVRNAYPARNFVLSIENPTPKSEPDYYRWLSERE